MKRYILALLACGLAVSVGMGTALAGGTSDTSGDGFHCYLFFTLSDGQFAQAMINNSDSNEVLNKADEFLEKYVDFEGGTLSAAMGNIEGTVCEPPVAPICEEQPPDTGGQD